MVIDTSAILAILQQESDYREFLVAIDAASSLRMSAATFVETSMVIEARYGREGLRELDQFFRKSGIELIPVDAEQGHSAREAFSRFGKGRHRASLNFGDCFSYAAARVLGEPLLFKGADFIHTDISRWETHRTH